MKGAVDSVMAKMLQNTIQFTGQAAVAQQLLLPLAVQGYGQSSLSQWWMAENEQTSEDGFFVGRFGHPHCLDSEHFAALLKGLQQQRTRLLCCYCPLLIFKKKIPVLLLGRDGAV